MRLIELQERRSRELTLKCKSLGVERAWTEAHDDLEIILRLGEYLRIKG